MSDRIEIKISGQKLTPEKFIEGVQAFFDLIKGVAKNVATNPVNWVVEVDKGSAVVRARVENPTPDAEQSIDLVVRGINALKRGTKTIPYGFTKDEIRAARRLAALRDGQEIQSALLQNGGAPEDLSQDIIPTADAILTGESYVAFGSIEGTIGSMSAKQAFCFMIDEPLYRREIVCYLQKDELEDKAIEAFRLRARIVVSGLIHYAREGYPATISADALKILPSESELPSVEEIQAIYQQYK
jgi:hypothetical protein